MIIKDMEHIDLPTAWARKNKKLIAREFIRRIKQPQREQPIGIFTAGLPGVGKTEFTQELIRDLVDKPLRIDMDEVAELIEGYSANKASIFRGGASVILAKIYDEATKAKIDFIFDGTFAHGNALLNMKRAIDHGYVTKIYFIYQEPQIAWKFTQDRELVEKRHIDREGFMDAYYKLYENMQQLQEQFKDVTISVIHKDGSNRVGRIIEGVDDIFDHIAQPLNREQLECVILE